MMRLPSNMSMIEIRCPLFRSHDALCIRCSGFLDGQSLSVRFQNKRDKQLHNKVFCENRYENCEIYRMVEKVTDVDYD